MDLQQLLILRLITIARRYINKCITSFIIILKNLQNIINNNREHKELVLSSIIFFIVNHHWVSLLGTSYLNVYSWYELNPKKQKK